MVVVISLDNKEKNFTTDIGTTEKNFLCGTYLCGENFTPCNWDLSFDTIALNNGHS